MSTTRSCSETKAEAFLNYDFDDDTDKVSNTVLSKQYESLVLNARKRMHTIALGYSNYLIVFKPMNKPYDAVEDRQPGYHSRKGLSNTSKKIMSLKPMQYVSSTEIYASKVHHNYIVKSEKDLVDLLHDTVYNHKYKIHCSLVDNMNKVIDYIYKEANTRVFKPNCDYNMKDFKLSPLFKGVIDLNQPHTIAPLEAEASSVEGDVFVWGLS